MSLLELVDALTLPDQNRVRQETAPGRTTTHTVTNPCLLEQLENAIRSSVSGRGGSSDPAARNVLNSDALYRFMLIQQQLREWCMLADVETRGRNAAGNLRAWYVTTLAVPGFNPDWYTVVLFEWMVSIRSMLNPRRLLELPDDCPICDASTWADDEGDTALHPLVCSYPVDHPDGVLAGAAVRCRACGEEWRGLGRIREIAWTLETVRDHVAETGHMA